MSDLDKAREALETMPNEDQHEMVYWRWCIKNYETIREALQNSAEQARVMRLMADALGCVSRHYKVCDCAQQALARYAKIKGD